MIADMFISPRLCKSYLFRPGLAVDTCLHLLYLVTPYDMADTVQYTAGLYHQVFFICPKSMFSIDLKDLYFTTVVIDVYYYGVLVG
jgi:hypothetical protein